MSKHGKSQRDRSGYDDRVAKDWKPEQRMDLHGLICADIRANTVEREEVDDPDRVPLTDEEWKQYLQELVRGRLPRNYWRHVAKAGGCQSKKHAVAVKIWMCCDRDGIPSFNGNDVPIGRKWEKVAELMNRLAAEDPEMYGPPEAKVWSRPRMQQFVYEGLARMVVMDAWRGGVIVNRSLDDVYKDVYQKLWIVLKRKRKARRNNEPKLETQSFARYPAANPAERQVITITGPPIDWSAKRKAARKCGWKPPRDL